MHIIIKRYGKNLEITKIEKSPSPIRVRNTRKRESVYGIRRSDSYRRTKKILMRSVLSAVEAYGNPLLITLTVRSQANNAYEHSLALRRFFLRLRAKYPMAHAIFVPELSPRYRIHFHGLLFGLPLSWGDLRKGKSIISVGSERTDRRLYGFWGNGWVDCRQTDGHERLGGYLAKYLGKAHEELLFAPMRLIRTTKGFPREERIVSDEGIWDVGCLIEGKMPSYQTENVSPFLGKIIKTYYKF